MSTTTPATQAFNMQDFTALLNTTTIASFLELLRQEQDDLSPDCEEAAILSFVNARAKLLQAWKDWQAKKATDQELWLADDEERRLNTGHMQHNTFALRLAHHAWALVGAKDTVADIHIRMPRRPSEGLQG